MLPSTDLKASAPRIIAFSVLNSPAHSYRYRRFACPLAGTDARLAEKRGLVTPSFRGTCTPYLLPVRLAHQIPACPAPPGTKLVFEFLVLTAVRSGEARSARWSEFDIGSGMWTVPASRMKARTEHRVPLSGQAVAILRTARRKFPRGELVFPSTTGHVIRDAAVSKLLRDLSIPAVPHGFRSSFRDWCGDTAVPRELAEACLAHTVANKVEAAYARTDLYNRRIRVMEDWAQYVAPGSVPPAQQSPSSA